MKHQASKYFDTDSSLELYLPLNEDSGTSKKDYSIFNRTSTATVGAIVNIDHPYISGGYCTQFNGSTGYISTDSNITFTDTEYFTFKFWTKCTQNTVNMPFIHHGIASLTQRCIIIYRLANTESFNIIYNDGITPRTVQIPNFFTSFNNIWVKCSVQIDFNNGIIKVYRNNSLFTTPVTIKPILFPSQNLKIYLGYYSFTNVYLTGKLADVQIYNRLIE